MTACQESRHVWGTDDEIYKTTDGGATIIDPEPEGTEEDHPHPQPERGDPEEEYVDVHVADVKESRSQ